MPWEDYITALREAPEERVLVELAPDPFTAARAARNPYLKPPVRRSISHVPCPSHVSPSLPVPRGEL